MQYFCNTNLFHFNVSLLRHDTLNRTLHVPVVFAMNHPGLDERLLVQWISRNRSGGRAAYAASNIIDPKSGCSNSSDFLEFLSLKGIVTRRGLAAKMRLASATEVPSPGRLNDSVFEEMSGLLSSGHNIIFAPEGETNPWPSLKPLKSGIARLSLIFASKEITNICIVPVAVHSMAVGTWFRDVVVEVGKEVEVRIDKAVTKDIAYCRYNNSERTPVEDIMNEISTRLMKMCDFIPFDILTPGPAPHHNGTAYTMSYN